MAAWERNKCHLFTTNKQIDGTLLSVNELIGCVSLKNFFQKFFNETHPINSFPCQLFANAKFFDQGAVLQNVFFRVVAQKAFAVTHKAQQGATARKIFFVDAEVRRKLFDAERVQGDLGLGTARVFFVAAVRFYDFGDFLFCVIDCHCKEVDG